MVTPLLMHQLEEQARERQHQQQLCLASCGVAADGCEQNQTSDFSQCMVTLREACLKSCRVYYQLPLADCLSTLCSPEHGSNKTNWPAKCHAETDTPVGCTSQKAECQMHCQ